LEQLLSDNKILNICKTIGFTLILTGEISDAMPCPLRFYFEANDGNTAILFQKALNFLINFKPGR